MPNDIREKYLIGFSALAVFALLFWSSYAFQNYINSFITILEGYFRNYPALGSTIFITLSALSAIISPFTSAPLIPAAVLIFGKFFSFLFLWLGWIIGGIFSYMLGRFAARPLAIKLFSDKKIAAYQKKLTQNTNFWLILLFRGSVPAEIPGPVLGALKYSLFKFTLATAIAELPYAIATIYASNALIAGQKFLFFTLVALIFLAMAGTYLYFHKKLG